MKHFLALCGLILVSALHAAPGQDVLRQEDIAVDYRNGHYYATLSLQTAAQPSVAQQVLTDFDHMSEFVPNLTHSRIISHAGNVFMIEQQGRAGFGPFSIRFASQRRVELLPGGKLVSQAVAGTARSMHSELHIQASGNGTRISYHLDMEPEHWMPSSVGISIMRHELHEQFTALAHEIERRQQLSAHR